MRPLLAALLVVALAGCGGGSGSPDRPRAATPSATPTATATVSPEPARGGPVTAEEEGAIRGWSDALRRGDVERAVSFWQVPALAANGGDPIRLLTRRAIRFFNETLPCGARLVRVRREANYVHATFVLSERPGPGSCAGGAGERAHTYFLVRGGKIVQWLRSLEDASLPPDPAGTES